MYASVHEAHKSAKWMPKSCKMQIINDKQYLYILKKVAKK